MSDQFNMGDPEPLYERIYKIMDPIMPWCMNDVQAKFPTESYWPLYRAMQRLEKDRRIVFFKNVDKKKYYRITQLNELPHIIDGTGKAHPSSVFVNAYQSFYDPGRRIWIQPDQQKFNRVPLLIGQLFVIADSDLTEADKKKQWDLVRNELMDARQVASKAIEWIDSITDHASMTGDMDKFVEVFNGKDSPDHEKILEFMRWANKYGTEQENPFDERK